MNPIFSIGVFGLGACAVTLADVPGLSEEPPMPIGPPATAVWSVPSAQEFVGPLTPAPGPLFPIEAIDFDGGAINTGGFYNIPPDPHGAVSATHLVNIVNTSIEWFRRSDGVRENTQLIGFSSLTPLTLGFFDPLTPANLLFDPKILYDQYEDRFVAVALEKVESGSNPDSGNISRILLAVSDDSNPNGTWCYQAIDSKLNQGGVDYWADYPGFAVDEEAVYITNNMFLFNPLSGSTFPQLWIVDKGVTGGLYDCAISTVTVHTPDTSFGGTKQPAHVYGAGGVPGLGTFVVSYSGLSGGGNEFLNIIAVTDPLGTPSFTQVTPSVGDIDDIGTFMPDAPQSGTADLIETNDRRALDAVWRNDALWVVAQVVPNAGDPNAGEATAHWWEIDTTGAPGAYGVMQQGDIGGEDVAAGAYTFFPSIAVNADGDTAIGFSVSADTIFAGAAYTWREIGDPAGTVQASEFYAPGVGPYLRTFGGPMNRWGDYSAAVVDVDDLNFCFYNEYAQAPGTAFGGEDGRWGTRWACTALGAIEEADLSIAKSDNPDPVIAGNNLLYTVTVTNNGPSDAQNVVVTDTLPAGVTFVATNGCAESPGGVPVCSLGTIAAGATDQYSIGVTVDADTLTGNINNAASVTSDTTDPVPGNNSANEITTVQTQADLSIAKSDNPDPVIAGNNLLYTVTVTNNGPSDAQNVVVTDTLPAGVTFVATNGCAESPGGVPVCSLGTIAAGATDQYSIGVTVDAGTPPGLITNSAVVGSDTPDSVPGNDGVTEDTTVQAGGGPIPCDADGDGNVDRLDLSLISRARGQAASGPNDPRDANGDGQITMADVKICVPQCDLPRCAIFP